MSNTAHIACQGWKEVYPAVWNPPAPAEGEMRHNMRKSHYCREPPAPAGGGSTITNRLF
jgi:hypothetical protein